MSSSVESNEKVEPEKVLKGVLNTLMMAAPKTNTNNSTTPGRPSATMSAFSTPSRSVSSVPEEEEDFTEDFQLQYPSPSQPHMEIEADDGQWKPNHDNDEDSEKTPSREDVHVTEESPRSALDGIPFNTTPASGGFAPTSVTPWNRNSPGRGGTNILGFSSLPTTKGDSPQRSLESVLNSSRPPSGTPPRVPERASENHSHQSSHPAMLPPPVPRMTPPRNVQRQTSPHESDEAAALSWAEGMLTFSAATQRAMNGLPHETEAQPPPPPQPQSYNANANISQASSMAYQSVASNGDHNDTTLLASNLQTFGQDMSSLQDMSQDTATFHNVTTFTPDRSPAERTAATPQPPIVPSPKVLPRSDQYYQPRQPSPHQSPLPDNTLPVDQPYPQSRHSRQGSGQQLQLISGSELPYHAHQQQRQASPRQSPLPDVPRSDQSQQWNQSPQYGQASTRQSPRLDASFPTRQASPVMPSANSTPERSQGSSELMYRPVSYEQAGQGSSAMPSAHSTPDCSYHSESVQQIQPPKQAPSNASVGSTPDRSYRSEPMQQLDRFQSSKQSQVTPSVNSTPDRSYHSEPIQGSNPPTQSSRQPPLTPSGHSASDRSFRSEPTRPSGKTVRHLRPPISSNQSVNSTPDRSQNGSVASMNRMDRFSKAQQFVRRIRGNLPGETETGIPPKPPSAPTTAPPVPPHPSVSASERTPVVSNQNRKTLSIEEKKETEDWSSTAVKQMSKAVDQIRQLGESFIYDESPSRDSKGSPNRDSQSGVSETSGQWWLKEQTFHTDGDEPIAHEMTKGSMEQPMQKLAGGSVASSQASPAPPPSINRTPHDPILMKPVAMELTRTADLILQPSMEERAVPEAARDHEEDVVQSVGTKTGFSVSLLSLDPSTILASGSRAMTPMMRMRVPGAQESVLMGDNEILRSATEEASVKTPVREEKTSMVTDTESSSPRHSVEFAEKANYKTVPTPDRSRRSKSSRSSKGLSRGSSTRRSRGSRRSGRRRRRVQGGFGLAHCEGGLPFFLQGFIDHQCGNLLGEEYGSESTYSSGGSGDESDGDTYGESMKSTPTRKKTPFLEMTKGINASKTDSTHDRQRPIDKERARQQERAMEMERIREEESIKQQEFFVKEKEKEVVAKERQVLERQRLEPVNQDCDKKEKERNISRAVQKDPAVEIAGQTTSEAVVDEERSVERVNRRRNEASNIRNKNFIREFISELTKEGIKLLQHRRSHRQAFSKPTEVRAYLRLGIEGQSNSFCEPCLQFLAYDGIPVVSVDLFDVRSLEKATALQLQAYPLAVPGNSLLIRTNPGDFVFEAKNEEDAVRIVHGMRWLIARLSFNLIIGNVNVSCELLDVGNKAFKQRVGESNRAMAMNDLTNHLVDKSSLYSS